PPPPTPFPYTTLFRSNEVALATTAAEVRAAAKAGKVAALMGMEGGHMIDDNLSVLRDYARLGVRYLTLTHSVNTNWADSSGDKPDRKSTRLNSSHVKI